MKTTLNSAAFSFVKTRIIAQVLNREIRNFATSTAKYQSLSGNVNGPSKELVKEQRRFQSLKVATLQQTESKEYDTINVEVTQGIRTITLNRPQKRNAISIEMYNEWIEALETAREDPETVVTAITGAGDFYCAGNDLSNLMLLTDEDSKEHMRNLIRHFVDVHFHFPKPLFAVINGPAIGISVSTLGLFDGVYASDQATFGTPFTKLQQGPEACSTFTFPLMMGLTNASQMLMLDQSVDADTASKLNLVTKVFPHAELENNVECLFRKFSQLPLNTLMTSKNCIRSQFRRNFEEAMNIEMTNLEDKMREIDLQETFAQFKLRKSAPR